MDKVDLKKDARLLKSREKDDAENGRRKKLLQEIEGKYIEYGFISPGIEVHGC